MNPKQILIISTMAFTITVGGTLCSDRTKASAPDKPETQLAKASAAPSLPDRKDLTGLLGMTGEELREELYGGRSLADVAEARRVGVQEVVGLQMAELTAQLEERCAAGSLTPAQLEAYKAELPELLAASAHTRMEA
ncbi:hypothetical protein N6H14_06795 [Paenibacillus sp. CC-CFT747]|nr:hypothetical protein N6H14_06795 [Paenibacillus sp. CC-CFT747]